LGYIVLDRGATAVASSGVVDRQFKKTMEDRQGKRWECKGKSAGADQCYEKAWSLKMKAIITSFMLEKC